MHVLSLLLMGTGVIRGEGLKQPEREFDLSPPSSAEAKIECSSVSTPSTSLHGANRDNSALLLTLGVMRGNSAKTAPTVLEKFNEDAIIKYCTSMEVVNFRLKDAHY